MQARSHVIHEKTLSNHTETVDLSNKDCVNRLYCLRQGRFMFGMTVMSPLGNQWFTSQQDSSRGMEKQRGEGGWGGGEGEHTERDRKGDQRRRMEARAQNRFSPKIIDIEKL